MKWLLWAKVNGEWRYLGAWCIDSEEFKAAHLLAICGEDASISLYCPLLSNGNQ